MQPGSFRALRGGGQEGKVGAGTKVERVGNVRPSFLWALREKDGAGGSEEGVGGRGELGPDRKGVRCEAQESEGC